MVKKNLKISKICHTLLIFVDFPRGSQFPKIVFLFLKFFLTIRCLEVDIEDGQELGSYKWYVYFYEILKFVWKSVLKSTLRVKILEIDKKLLLELVFIFKIMSTCQISGQNSKICNNKLISELANFSRSNWGLTNKNLFRGLQSKNVTLTTPPKLGKIWPLAKLQNWFSKNKKFSHIRKLWETGAY